MARADPRPPRRPLIVEPPLVGPQTADHFRSKTIVAPEPEARRKPAPGGDEGAQEDIGPADGDRLLEEVAAPDDELREDHAPRQVAGADPDLVAIEIIGAPPGGALRQVMHDLEIGPV